MKHVTIHLFLTSSLLSGRYMSFLIDRMSGQEGVFFPEEENLVASLILKKQTDKGLKIEKEIHETGLRILNSPDIEKEIPPLQNKISVPASLNDLSWNPEGEEPDVLMSEDSGMEIDESSDTDPYFCLPIDPDINIKEEEVSVGKGQDGSMPVEYEVKQFDDFLKKLDPEGEHEAWMKRWKELVGFQKNGLWGLEYCNDNKENFLAGFRELFPENYEDLKIFFEKGQNGYKWLNDVAPLALNALKYSKIRYDEQQWEKEKQRYNELKAQAPVNHTSSSLEKIHKYLHNWGRQLEKEKQEALDKALFKLVRVITKFSAVLLEYSALELTSKTAGKIGKFTFKIFKNIWEFWDIKNSMAIREKWFYHLQSHLVFNIHSEDPRSEQDDSILDEKISQAQIKDDLKNFLNFLKNCNEIEDVREHFNQMGISVELPLSIQDFKDSFGNPRFQRQIIQSYYQSIGQRAIMNEKKLSKLLLNKEQEHNRRVERSLIFIFDQIDHCESMSFPEIQAHFDHLHIHLDAIEIEGLGCPPTTSLEWEECIQNEEFCNALAEQWIDFQETTALLAMQMLRQALLSKLGVETQFLSFRRNECYIGIVSAMAQLVLCVPQAHLYTFSFILELIFKDFTKIGIPGIGIVHVFSPLYPGVHFRVEGIFMLLCEHFFAIKYKPNEYSIKSYRKTIYKQMIEFTKNAYWIHSQLQKALLWLNIRLIENCILRLENKPLAEDERFIQMNDRYEELSLDFRQRIKELEKDLQDLRIKDAKLIINSGMKHPESHDPIQEIVDGLKEADLDYFPLHVLEFFEDNAGIKLTNEKKEHLKKDFEKVFYTNEHDFVRTFDSNRFAYLRA